MSKIFTILFLSVASAVGYAQTAASYSFAASSGTYSSIAATGTAVAGVHGDDITATSIPIGFSFSYCGTAHTLLSACSNGWLSLNNSTSTSFSNSTATLASMGTGLLMPMWGDLNGTWTTSAAYYQTTGTAPNRVFTFEWVNYSFYAITGSSLNFQVKLYETSNEIQFAYGSSVTGTAGYLGTTIGLANSTTDYQTIDSFSASIPGSFQMHVPVPAAGTIYTYNGTATTGCTGAPASGTATVTVSSTCATTTVALTATGAAAGSGISYQWQVSIDGGATWSSVSGATSTSYTGAFTGCNATQYRIMVTCSGSGMSSYSYTSVVTPNKISGYITYGGYAAPSATTMKVWLVKYNPADSSITAVDSTTACDYTVNQYYEFDGQPAGLYRVKARLMSSTPGASGFIPTYSLSTPYWYLADTTPHTSNCDSLHIDMMYGTVPSGPGFIGGYVYSGAGRATTGDVPEPGMLMYLRNASGTILTHTYTDATGAYSFSGIANGSYTIYPEGMGFMTTPSAAVVLDAAHETINAVDFKKHTIARTITPYTVPNSVSNVSGAGALSIYPNPAANFVNIDWTGAQMGSVNVTITDVAGRTVSNSVIEIANTNGSAKINIADLNNGIYAIIIKGNGLSQTSKLVIAR